MATASIARQIGSAVAKAARNRNSGRGGGVWYGPHMAAASRAIQERIPLVDLVLEVRDARVRMYVMRYSFLCRLLNNGFLILKLLEHAQAV